MRPHNDPNFIRQCIFTPYRKGMGPRFVLNLYDTNSTGWGGKSRLRYELRQIDVNGKYTTLFEGSDFRCSPLHGIDSDDTIKSLMGFLTLRPGDTDQEYFDDYTPEQLKYCSQHAESLSFEVYSKFGE
jgi:hypothetical protein